MFISIKGNSIYETSMTLSLPFILFYVQSIASSIGFEWPEELAMVLSVMLSHFHHFPVFTPCPCEVLCSHDMFHVHQSGSQTVFFSCFGQFI